MDKLNVIPTIKTSRKEYAYEINNNLLRVFIQYSPLMYTCPVIRAPRQVDIVHSDNGQLFKINVLNDCVWWPKLNHLHLRV